MSNSAAETDAGVPAEWDELELAVRRLLDQSDAWRKLAEKTRARVRELETALEEYSSGKVDPIALNERLSTLEEENERLRAQLERARGSVDRILGRLEFVEEQP